MNKKEYIQWLKQFEPCQEALEWSVKTDYETAQQAWELCERGDWMLWLIKRNIELETGSKDHKRLVAVVCKCARLAEQWMPAKSIHCLEQVEKWCNGDMSIDLIKVRKSAVSADADAFDYAAIHAADAAAYVAYAAYAADVAAYAVDAFDYATDAAEAADADEKGIYKKCADEIREFYPEIKELIGE